MRLALVVAFIGSVLFHVDVAEARSHEVPSAEARKAPKAKKRHAKAKARAKKKKVSKRPRKARVETDDEDEVATTNDVVAPAPASEVVAPAPSRRPAVAQATDDEEPGPAPKRK